MGDTRLATIPQIGSSKVSLVALTKAYRHHGRLITVFESLSLEIAPGSFTTFLGPSGCGKTTLLRLIAGLERPTDGSVIIDGETVQEPSVKVGMVFQSYTTFPWLTVRENLGFGLRLQDGVSTRDAELIVEDILTLVGLKEFEHVYPSALSGGMKQRVALGRALALSPDILLLDEPFGALDAQTRTLLQDELTGIWERLDTTVCLVTHDIEEALLLSDVIHVLSAKPTALRRTVLNPFPHPRLASLRTDREFLAMRMELFEVIRGDARMAMAAEAAGLG